MKINSPRPIKLDQVKEVYYIEEMKDDFDHIILKHIEI